MKNVETKTPGAKATKASIDIKQAPNLSAKEFDRLFDEGSDDIDLYLDTKSAKRIPAPLLTPTKVNVDFPKWVVMALDKEADRIGVARQALIKLWIVECLNRARE